MKEKWKQWGTRKKILFWIAVPVVLFIGSALVAGTIETIEGKNGTDNKPAEKTVTHEVVNPAPPAKTAPAPKPELAPKPSPPQHESAVAKKVRKAEELNQRDEEVARTKEEACHDGGIGQRHCEEREEEERVAIICSLTENEAAGYGAEALEVWYATCE